MMRQYLFLHFIAFAAGCMLDLIIGDPYNIPHPIKAIGSLISALEKKLYINAGELPGDERNRALKRRGTLLCIIVIVITFLCTATALIAAYMIHPYAGAVAEAVLTCYILAGRCLCDESMKVSRYLKEGDLETARIFLSMIVGRDTDKLDEKGCHGAPDWIVEVTSPSTKKRDYGLKLFRYRDAGVREYWIIDLQQRIVMVYVFDTEPEDAGIYSFEDEITPSLYPDLKIRIADMLG